jgi:saccharopine dehydrogenase-like NADP-dependent oxidoreductase
VLLVGGAGFFGRHVVADLLQHTETTVVVADRHPRRATRHTRVTAAGCDANDVAALSRLAEGCAVVVHCAGPFHSMPLGPVRAAVAARAHYVDISEDRSFRRRVEGFHDQARGAGTALLTGMSVVPAMEALAAELLRPRLDELLAVRTFVAPDTRRHRGLAMFHTMLRLAGRHSDVLRDGRRVQVRGWSEPEWVRFRPPVGWRLTYLA